VKGFWSLTLYNEYHLFTKNALNRVSLGTKSKSFLKYNPDGSLTLYFGAKSPGEDKESNWVPRAEWHVLALHPRLLAGHIHPRCKLDAAQCREDAVSIFHLFHGRRRARQAARRYRRLTDRWWMDRSHDPRGGWL
jgi:Protein of unknown function (DUF1214)